MDLVPALILLAIGFFVLLYSGDCLVRGALAAANKLNVSSLLVGVLIVGFGTSLPEFIIALRAAVEGSNGLAHGAIVGSNIANIWLVIALPAVIFPISSVAPRMRITATVMLLATAAWIGITYYMGLNPIIGASFWCWPPTPSSHSWSRATTPRRRTPRRKASSSAWPPGAC
jgi:cation:H+ antiporter